MNRLPLPHSSSPNKLVHTTRSNNMVGVLMTLVVVLLASMTAQAQTYIFGRADFPVGNFPVAIAAGDFNGDGLSDIVVVNNADNTVSILLGRPDGIFGLPTAYPAGPEPVALVIEDFNADGNLDVAVTNGNCTAGKYNPLCSASTVSILLAPRQVERQLRGVIVSVPQCDGDNR